jgi:hypothetical protein
MTERQASLQIADQLMQTSIWMSSSFALTIRLPLHRRISAGSLPGGDSRIHFHSFKGCLSLPKLNISADAGTMVLASRSLA